MRTGAYVALLTGLAFIVLSNHFLSFFIGLVILLASLYVLTTRSGIIIDSKLKMYKAYTSYFGIKRGVWKSMGKLTDIAILNIRMSSSLLSRGNARISALETVYKVYFLSKTHRTRVFVKSFVEAIAAEELMRDLSKDLGLQIAKYNPQKLRK